MPVTVLAGEDIAVTGTPLLAYLAQPRKITVEEVISHGAVAKLIQYLRYFPLQYRIGLTQEEPVAPLSVTKVPHSDRN